MEKTMGKELFALRLKINHTIVSIKFVSIPKWESSKPLLYLHFSPQRNQRKFAPS